MKGVGSESRQHQDSNCHHKAASFDKQQDGETIDWSPTSGRFAVPGQARSHARNHPIHLDDTLHDTVPKLVDEMPWYRKVESRVRHVGTNPGIAGLTQLLTGIVIYAGGCPGDHMDVSLAHLIKGDTFWCYGLVTFSRFLGAFSELSWAWNRIPIAHRKMCPLLSLLKVL